MPGPDCVFNQPRHCSHNHAPVFQGPYPDGVAQSPTRSLICHAARHGHIGFSPEKQGASHGGVAHWPIKLPDWLHFSKSRRAILKNRSTTPADIQQTRTLFSSQPRHFLSLHYHLIPAGPTAHPASGKNSQLGILGCRQERVQLPAFRSILIKGIVQ